MFTAREASVKIVTMLDKSQKAVLQKLKQIIHVLIPNEFVVGYGLNYNENYRNLPYVGVLRKFPTPK